MRPIAVLVVDDSPFARKAIRRMLSGDPSITVVGEAGDGERALALAEALRPDVVTLDLEMPGMDGLSTLAHLRAARAVPVIVLSGATERSAGVTMQALENGAFEVVAKPAGGPLAIHEVAVDLIAKIHAAAGFQPAAAHRPPHPCPGEERRASPVAAAVPPSGVGLIVIGISTGGPSALQQLLPALPADLPVPVVVLQHMPPGYTRTLAERLNRLSPLMVLEAVGGDVLTPGRVLIAPSGRQLGFRGREVVVTETCPIPSYYRPSIDWALMQAAEAWGRGVLAVVMTGMGSDGAAGVRAVKAAGGAAWAQDEATSAIYGMPRAALETGLVDLMLPLGAIAPALTAAAAAAPAPGPG